LKEPTVKNSSEFLHEFKQYSIGHDEVIVSFGVKSLFTSIPVDLALAIAIERLQQDQKLTERTKMSVTAITTALQNGGFARLTTVMRTSKRIKSMHSPKSELNQC